MKNYKNLLIISVLLCLTAFSFFSCGGSGGGSGGSVSSGAATGSASGTGSVAILLTDNDTEEFSKIEVTITKIELLSDNGKVTVFSGHKTIDFLDLRNETMLLSVKNKVPAMWFNKIRLTVEYVELYDTNGERIDKPVKLTGNQKIDLNPRRRFHVVPGEILTIQIDLDAQHSFILNENKKSYKFDPVIFIDIRETFPPAKLLRVSGIVHDIKPDARRFTLCIADDDEYGHDNDRCIIVSVSDDTSIFDADNEGNPAAFEDIMVGDEVTAIGFHHEMFCPAHYDDDDHEACKMTLSAIVVEIGNFQRIKGHILAGDNRDSPVSDDNTFDLSIDSNHVITVQLQDDTKIFSLKKGKLVDESSLKAGEAIELDGIPLDRNGDQIPDEINAAFILMDLEIKLSGVISEKNYANQTIYLTSGIECIKTTTNTQIYLIDTSEHSSKMIDFSDLQDGMHVDAYGYDYNDTHCLIANTVLAFEK